MRLLLIAPLDLPWHTSRYIIRSFQKLDWEVVGFDYRNPLSTEDEVNNKLKYLLPLKFDLILLLKGELIKPEVLAEFKAPKALWYFDLPLIPRLLELGRICDRFFLHIINEKVRLLYSTHGIEITHLPQGVDPSFHFPVSPSASFKSTIAFMGSFDKDREKVLAMLAQRYQNLKLWGNGWQNSSLSTIWQGFPAYHADYRQICSSSRIILNLGRVGMAQVDISARIFMTAACKGFQLSPDIEDLEDYFIKDKEIVVFFNQKDLRSKIQFYLKHSKERKLITEAAYLRVLKDHLYDKRVKEMLKCLGL